MFAKSIGVSVRTIHNWISDTTTSIPVKWHDKIEYAVNYVHKFRTERGFDVIISEIPERNAQITSQGSTSAPEVANASENASLFEMPALQKNWLEMLANVFQEPVSDIVNDAVYDWLVNHLFSIYDKIYCEGTGASDDELKSIEVVRMALSNYNAANRRLFAARQIVGVHRQITSSLTATLDKWKLGSREQRLFLSYAGIRFQDDLNELDKTRKDVDEAKTMLEKAINELPHEGSIAFMPSNASERLERIEERNSTQE